VSCAGQNNASGKIILQIKFGKADFVVLSKRGRTFATKDTQTLPKNGKFFSFPAPILGLWKIEFNQTNTAAGMSQPRFVANPFGSNPKISSVWRSAMATES
jgi:hypothetical protein